MRFTDLGKHLARSLGAKCLIYALVLGLIAIVGLLSVQSVGTRVQALFTGVAADLAGREGM